MKTVKNILLGLAAVAALAAQDVAVMSPPAETHRPEPPQLRRVFVLKYADPPAVSNALTVFGYSITANRDLHIVAVTAPAEGIAAIEDAIKRLDVPAAAPKDVDLTVYMIVASEQASGDASLPSELQPVANQLKKIFAYKSFHVLDSILLRTQPGNRAVASGTLPEGHTTYSFEVRPSNVTDDPQGRLIRLDNLRLGINGINVNAGIQTEITVREGQRVVVGKSNMGAGGSLILVVTAKVTD